MNVNYSNVSSMPVGSLSVGEQLQLPTGPTCRTQHPACFNVNISLNKQESGLVAKHV